MKLVKIILLILVINMIGCGYLYFPGDKDTRIISSSYPFKDTSGQTLLLIDCYRDPGDCVYHANQVCPGGFKIIKGGFNKDDFSYNGWMIITFDPEKCK